MKNTSINLVSIASTVPEQLVLSNDIINAFNGRLSDGAYEMLEKMGIKQRYAVVGDYAKYLSGKVERELITDVNTMAVDSINRCIASEKETNIGLFITITNTAARPLPCTAYEIISLIDESILPRNITILNLQNQGCSTIIKAIEMAQFYLACKPDKQVLITISEAHTALFPPVVQDRVLNFVEIDKTLPHHKQAAARKSLIDLINGYLFGDAAISLLLDNQPSASTFVCEHLTNIAHTDTDILFMNEGGSAQPVYSGFPHYCLTSSVPRRGIMYNKLLFKKFWESSSQEEFVKNLDLVLIHTGSRKIIDGIVRALKLQDKPEKTRLSYEIIEEYGNLSSCSVAFMLEKALNVEKRTGEFLLASFGVGFSGSMAMWSAR